MLYRRDKSGRVEGHIVEVHVSCWDEGRRRAAAQGMLWWESTAILVHLGVVISPPRQKELRARHAQRAARDHFPAG
jgi:hypothetical protein